MDQHRGRAAGRPRRRAAAPGRPAHPRACPTDADGFVHVDEHGRVAGLADVYAAGDMTVAPAQAGRPGHAAGRRRRGRDRRRRRAPTSRPRPTGRCCARCCSPAAARATCAARPRDRGHRQPTRRPGGRRTRSPGRELAPYLTAHPELRLEPSNPRREGAAHVRPPRSASSSPAAASPPLEAVLALHALAGDRVAIELLAPAGEFVERPVVGALAVQRRRRAARAARRPARARRHPPPRRARRRRRRRATRSAPPTADGSATTG